MKKSIHRIKSEKDDKPDRDADGVCDKEDNLMSLENIIDKQLQEKVNGQEVSSNIYKISKSHKDSASQDSIS